MNVNIIVALLQACTGGDTTGKTWARGDREELETVLVIGCTPFGAGDDSWVYLGRECAMSI